MPAPDSALWEPQADEHLFGRGREDDEIAGIHGDILLTRASDDMVHEMGQDGGLVSAILIWAMREGYIDGALTSYLEGGDATTWKAVPGVATNRDEVLAAAGSRYTYSANTLALDEALDRGLKQLALVGMSCQSSVPPVMWSRKIGKIGKPIVFNIGLLCSKTFDDAIFEELFEAKYGLPKAEIVKMNIKGVFQIWMRDGTYHEINLKECHAWTREGCTHCPDFAAEHADISTGGIGKDNDWTLTIVRTDLGREIITRMIADGSIIARPGDEDPGAIALMRKLAEKSRSRWPTWAETRCAPRPAREEGPGQGGREGLRDAPAGPRPRSRAYPSSGRPSGVVFCEVGGSVVVVSVGRVVPRPARRRPALRTGLQVVLDVGGKRVERLARVVALEGVVEIDEGRPDVAGLGGVVGVVRDLVLEHGELALALGLGTTGDVGRRGCRS